jgi:hypothetical protein
MKLSWMFGSSMEAHHLLASYLIVWLIQGGYAAWIVWQWRRTEKELQPDLSVATQFDEDS